MINIKSSLLYAALAACLGGGYGAHYLVSQANMDRVLAAECDDYNGKPKLDKIPRPLSRGGNF